MARYDYRCGKCSSIQEVRHGMNDTPFIKCPHCETIERMHKIMQISEVMYKCDGFVSKDGKL